jgi:hypothetical protein
VICEKVPSKKCSRIVFHVLGIGMGHAFGGRHPDVRSSNPSIDADCRELKFVGDLPRVMIE